MTEAALPAADAVTLARPSDGLINFSLSLPFVGTVGDALPTTLAEIARSGGLAGLLDYGDGEARMKHVEAAAAWLGRSGLVTNADHLVITTERSTASSPRCSLCSGRATRSSPKA